MYVDCYNYYLYYAVGQDAEKKLISPLFFKSLIQRLFGFLKPNETRTTAFFAINSNAEKFIKFVYCFNLRYFANFNVIINALTNEAAVRFLFRNQKSARLLDLKLILGLQ